MFGAAYAVSTVLFLPGNILTPMLDNEWFHRTLRPDLPEPTMADAAQVIGHFHMLPAPLIEARAVSDAVLFLASDEAKYITGAALPIDAGAVATVGPLGCRKCEHSGEKDWIAKTFLPTHF